MLRKLSVSSLLFILCVLISHEQLHAQPSCQTENNTFSSGEKITYIISYDWFVIWTEVGEAVLTTKEVKYQDVPAYEITGLGTTYKSWDWIFKVRDKFISIVEKETLKPMYAGRDINEGNYKQLEKTWFDFTDTLAYSDKKTNDNPMKTDTVPVTPCTFDIMSALYYARNIDFSNMQVGDKIPIDIFLDQELYPIYFRYQGIETIKVKDIGKFECIKFTVMLIEGEMFHEGENMTVWATNDRNKIPVYAESPILVGSIKVRLSNIENSRYPIDAFKD